SPLLVVDRVGVLATLYGAGTMAYVGGGFGRAGLHSVLEPAAWGVPVAFGPNWQDSRDAELLLRGGAGEALGRAAGTKGNGAVLAGWWERWIADESYGGAQGRAGRARLWAGGVGRRRGGRGWRGGWGGPADRRRCWPGLFRHDPLDGDRPRHEDPRGQ